MPLTDTDPPLTARSSADGAGIGRYAEPRSWMSSEGLTEFMRSPSAALGRPGGKRATLFADRVRARPAFSPTVSMFLGQNAAMLGIWGLAAPRSVQKVLGTEASLNSIRLLFGAREMATAWLLADPTRKDLLWARVAGDVFDIAVLRRLDGPHNAQRRNARIALGVVLAVTALDLITAVRMTTVKRNCA